MYLELPDSRALRRVGAERLRRVADAARAPGVVALGVVGLEARLEVLRQGGCQSPSASDQPARKLRVCRRPKGREKHHRSECALSLLNRF